MGTPNSIRFLESVRQSDHRHAKSLTRFEASPDLSSPNRKQVEDALQHGAVESADNAESAKIPATGQRRKTIAPVRHLVLYQPLLLRCLHLDSGPLNAQGFSS